MSSACPHVRAHVREGRGSLQLEYDDRVDRQTQLMRLAAQNGRRIEVREIDGVRLWLVPADLVSTVGCMAAVVR